MEVSYKEIYKMNREETKRKLLETYWKTDNISETVQQWFTSRQVGTEGVTAMSGERRA